MKEKCDSNFTDYFFEGYKDFPICNHVQNIGPENIGYTTGMTSIGLPFEVEVYCYGKGNELQKELAIIMPDCYAEEDDCNSEFCSMEAKKLEDDTNITAFSGEMEIVDYSVLSVGMIERGQEESFAIIQWYLDYIEALGIVRFKGNMRNCAVFYYTDIYGNDLVQIKTGLIMNGKVEAETDIQFRDFPNRTKNIRKSLTVLK